MRTEPRRLDDADIQGCKHVAFLWSHWGNLVGSKVFLQWDGRLSKDEANGFTGPILFYFFCCPSFTINCQPIIVVKRSQMILFDHKDFIKLTIRQ